MIDTHSLISYHRNPHLEIIRSRLPVRIRVNHNGTRAKKIEMPIVNKDW